MLYVATRSAATPCLRPPVPPTELANACKEAILNARVTMAQHMTETMKNVAGFDLDEAPAAPDPRIAWRQALKESGWNQ